MSFQPRYSYAKRAKVRREQAWEAMRAALAALPQPPKVVFDGGGHGLFFDHMDDARRELRLTRYDPRAATEAYDRVMAGQEPLSTYHRALACRGRLNGISPPALPALPCGCREVMPRGWTHRCPRGPPSRFDYLNNRFSRVMDCS